MPATIGSWWNKAQAFAIRNMNNHFQNWLDNNPNAAKYRKAQYKPRKSINGVDSRSPYAYGFDVPDYIRDLQEAMGKGDEETAKAIMMFKGDGPCNPYN
jgi:hypothetical protein